MQHATRITLERAAGLHELYFCAWQGMPNRNSETLLMMSLYCLVVFSRPDKDILKQYLLKTPAPGWHRNRHYSGGLWERGQAHVPALPRDPLPAVIASG